MRDNNSRDFLYYICRYPSLSDEESLTLTKTFMQQYSFTKQIHIANQSYTKRYGTTDLIKAVTSGKLKMIKYLVDLGIDQNVAERNYQHAALDAALDRAEQVRWLFIGKLAETVNATERMASIEDRTAFDKFRWLGDSSAIPDYSTGGSQNHDKTKGFFLSDQGTITEKQYFNAPKIIDFLELSGVRRATRRPASEASDVSNPFLTDMSGVGFQYVAKN